MTCCALESITIHSQEVSAFTTQWMWMSHIILSQTKCLFSLHRLTVSCDSFSKLPTHLPTDSHKTSQRTGRESPLCYPYQGSLIPFCSGLEGSKVTWVNIAIVIALGGHWETAGADSRVEHTFSRRSKSCHLCVLPLLWVLVKKWAGLPLPSSVL